MKESIFTWSSYISHNIASSGITYYTTNYNNGKESLPRVERSKIEFEHGSCASIAICEAFNIPILALDVICDLLRIKNHCKGLTYIECRKILKVICKNRYICKYSSNTSKITYYQQLLLNERENIYIYLFDEHLSYAKNMIVHDSYYSYRDICEVVPMGWWKITKIYKNE